MEEYSPDPLAALDFIDRFCDLAKVIAENVPRNDQHTDLSGAISQLTVELRCLANSPILETIGGKADGPSRMDSHRARPRTS